MKTNSYSGGKILKNLALLFDNRMLNRLARQSGFMKRTPKKITPFAFIISFMQACSTKGALTYSAWAAAIGILTAKALSKQGLWERMSEQTAAFAKAVFCHLLPQQPACASFGRCPVLKQFKRVLLQDSTTLSLPQHLSAHYPGNRVNGVQKAVARLQCVLNVSAMQWLHLCVDAYTDNDQQASGIVVPLLRKGDLLIRDLGYFVLEILQQITDSKAFFISRLRYGVNLFDEKGKPVVWKVLSKGKAVVDRQCFIGEKQKMAVRIIMLKLPADQANERVRRARQDRDKRVNHSEDYYQWLRYHVFITNVEPGSAGAKDIAQLYRIRWQVEVLFKSWKSGFAAQRVLLDLPATAGIERVNTTIYLLLLWMCIVMQKICCRYCETIRKQFNRYLSPVKLASFLAKNFLALLQLSSRQLLLQLVKHCCFEKRKHRTNMAEFFFELKLP